MRVVEFQRTMALKNPVSDTEAHSHINIGVCDAHDYSRQPCIEAVAP